MCWSSGCGRVSLEITRQQAASVSQSGKDASADVAALRRVPQIRRQLAKIDAALLRLVLCEYGAWDDTELQDHDRNLSRLVWIAGSDLTEAMTAQDYEKQATDFLTKHGLTFKAEFVGKNCPPFAQAPGDDPRYPNVPKMRPKGNCPKCGDVHGWEYRVTLEHTTPPLAHTARSVSFPFWNSYADTHFSPRTAADPAGDRPRRGEQFYHLRDMNGYPVGGNVVYRRPRDDEYVKEPAAYDVLACISGDVHCDTDFVEWCSEYGYDTDSRRAEAIHRRCVEFALKLHQFFTDSELTDLGEIT